MRSWLVEGEDERVDVGQGGGEGGQPLLNDCLVVCCAQIVLCLNLGGRGGGGEGRSDDNGAGGAGGNGDSIGGFGAGLFILPY